MITVLIEEYIKQLRNPDFISQFSDDELQEQLRLANDLTPGIAASLILSSVKHRPDMKQVLDKYMG
jgi:hypothetical protein